MRGRLFRPVIVGVVFFWAIPALFTVGIRLRQAEENIAALEDRLDRTGRGGGRHFTSPVLDLPATCEPGWIASVTDALVPGDCQYGGGRRVELCVCDETGEGYAAVWQHVPHYPEATCWYFDGSIVCEGY